MKSLITTAALLVAGTALSSAAVFTTTTVSSATTVGNGSYNGFAANFTNSQIGETVSDDAAVDFASVETLYLTNLTLLGRTNGTTGAGVSFKVAVYSYVDDSNVGDLLALSNEAQTSTTGGSMTFTFDNAELGAADATYQFLFVNADTTYDTLATSGLSGYQAQAVSAGISLLQSSNIPGGSGTYKGNGLNSWEGHYIPNFTLTTTDTIPEPSAFGLLAGIGALALVAARRRRSK